MLERSLAASGTFLCKVRYMAHICGACACRSWLWTFRLAASSWRPAATTTPSACGTSADENPTTQCPRTPRWCPRSATRTAATSSFRVPTTAPPRLVLAGPSVSSLSPPFGLLSASLFPVRALCSCAEQACPWHLRSARCISSVGGRGDAPGLMTCKRGGQVWNLRNHTCIKTLAGHDEKVMCVDVALGGHYLASASYDRTFKLWAPGTG